MNRKEIVNRKIGLTFDFVRELIEYPERANKIPDNCEIEFIEKDFLVKQNKSFKNKYLIKVKNSFEPINKVAEPAAIYKRRKK